MVNLGRAQLVPLPDGSGVSNYYSAFILYLDEVISAYEYPEIVLDNYGGVANFAREYVSKLRQRIGKDTLISVVISDDLFKCRCEGMSECIILKTLSQLIKQERDVDPSYASWINGNSDRVKDLVSFVSNDEIDFVYFRGDEDNYVLYEGHNFQKSGDQPVSRLAALNRVNDPKTDSKSAMKLRRQRDIIAEFVQNLGKQVPALMEVVDEHPDELATDLHRDISNRGDPSDMRKEEEIKRHFVDRKYN